MNTVRIPRPRVTPQPDRHTLATSYTVVSTRGRHGIVLIVSRCPFCGCAHVHRAKGDFLVGRRQAACRAGHYVLHAVVREGAA